MRYEEWADEEGSVFLPDDENKQGKLAVALTGEPELLWSVVADSWEEGCTALHEHRGWEPTPWMGALRSDGPSVGGSRGIAPSNIPDRRDGGTLPTPHRGDCRLIVCEALGGSCA
jgi:hypothetical protein